MSSARLAPAKVSPRYNVGSEVHESQRDFCRVRIPRHYPPQPSYAGAAVVAQGQQKENNMNQVNQMHLTQQRSADFYDVNSRERINQN